MNARDVCHLPRTLGCHPPRSGGSAVFLAALLLASPLAAQQPAAKSTFDRRAVPPAGRDPQLKVPTWTKATLTNGAQLVVVERHALPLVAVQINFVGGANQYEPATKTGLASFVASQILEGTSHRTADQIANEMQLLGVNFSPGIAISGEAGRVYFTAMKDKLSPVLDIVADLVENATFPQAGLESYRARRLQTLTQDRDRTDRISAVVFPKTVYGVGHPYGRSTTEATARAITRDDLVSFYNAYFQPGHAIITVVGDVTPAETKAMFERAFAAWKSGGSMPAFSYPAVQAPKATTIYLVDKPGAAQSTFAIGAAGPARSTPDYYAVRVMNEMLGVLFQSRLNHNIREEKSYSYGVGSGFAFGRGPGPFNAGGNIMTAKNDSALIEFMKELRDIRGPRPPTDDELAQAKASLVQSLPESFESVASLNGNVASIYTQGLPEDYYQQFAKAVNAVTKADVVRAARQYIDPDHMTIVIVGDRAKIERPLAATKIGPVVVLDMNGDPMSAKVTP